MNHNSDFKSSMIPIHLMTNKSEVTSVKSKSLNFLNSDIELAEKTATFVY